MEKIRKKVDFGIFGEEKSREMEEGNLTGPTSAGDDKVGVIFIAFISPKWFWVWFSSPATHQVSWVTTFCLCSAFFPLLKVAGHSFYCSCHTFIVLLIKLVCSSGKNCRKFSLLFLTIHRHRSKGRHFFQLQLIISRFEKSFQAPLVPVFLALSVCVKNI